MKIKKSSTKLVASVKAVITLFLSLPGEDRLAQVIRRVGALDEDEVRTCLDKVMTDFAGRHRHFRQTLREHYHLIEARLGSPTAAASHAAASPAAPLSAFPDDKKLLLGAIFTKEYSIQSAALFNPSIVAHPDQQALKTGEKRFLLSLRATGEGHISSIVFQTGVVDREGEIRLDPSTGWFTRLKKSNGATYRNAFIRERAEDPSALEWLPDAFTATEARTVLAAHRHDPSRKRSMELIDEILDSNYDLEPSPGIPMNEKVIFPSAEAERMGMEDVRFVQFEADGRVAYYGLYTAYDGQQIRTQLIETEDFQAFRIRTLFGAAIADKGMVLFPEKIDGKYVMISRQGGQNINIMFSENLYRWDKYDVLMEPKYPWEILQTGNCGSPIRTTKGWLLLTHGVGMVRTYVISAILLDLKDPTRIIGRLDQPFIEAGPLQREGYVPNVVYTCGMLIHGDLLLIPYAVSDSATEFMTLSLNELLTQLTKSC